MPKFGVGVHRFEKHQVNHGGHIHTGIEHIHADGNVEGTFAGGFESVDEIEAVIDFMGDDSRPHLRVCLMDDIANELGMLLAAGEEDGFSNSVSAGHLDTMAEDLTDNFSDSVFVVQFEVDFFGLDLQGNVERKTIVVDPPVLVFPLLLLFGAKVFVGHTVAEDDRGALKGFEGDQISLVDGFVQRVVSRGLAVVKLEKCVRIMVDVAARRGGEPQQ